MLDGTARYSSQHPPHCTPCQACIISCRFIHIIRTAKAFVVVAAGRVLFCFSRTCSPAVGGPLQTFFHRCLYSRALLCVVVFGGCFCVALCCAVLVVVLFFVLCLCSYAMRCFLPCFCFCRAVIWCAVLRCVLAQILLLCLPCLLCCDVLCCCALLCCAVLCCAGMALDISGPPRAERTGLARIVAHFFTYATAVATMGGLTIS